MLGSNRKFPCLVKEANIPFISIDVSKPITDQWCAETMFRLITGPDKYKQILLRCLYEGYYIRSENGLSSLIEDFVFEERMRVVIWWTLADFFGRKFEQGDWLPLPAYWWCLLPLEQRKIARQELVLWIQTILAKEGDVHGVG